MLMTWGGLARNCEGLLEAVTGLNILAFAGLMLY